MFPAIFMFVTVAVGVLAGYELLMPYLYPDQHRIRNRLENEFVDDVPTSGATDLFQSTHNFQLPMIEVGAATDNARSSAAAQFASVLKQVGIPLTPLQLALISLALGLAAAFTVQWFVGFWFGALAGLAAATLPIAFIHRRIVAWREQLLRQLPAAFDLMGRVLRAGGSISQALYAIIDGFESPLKDEINRCHKHMELGLAPEITYQDLAHRSGVMEMRLFVMAMTIQRQTGGNLSEILERLAGMVRARLRLRQQVLTLTAEGRMQGLVLMVLPFFIFGIMFFINPDYARELFHHWNLIFGTMVAMAAGSFWIRRIVHFDY